MTHFLFRYATELDRLATSMENQWDGLAELLAEHTAHGMSGDLKRLACTVAVGQPIVFLGRTLPAIRKKMQGLIKQACFQLLDPDSYM